MPISLSLSLALTSPQAGLSVGGSVPPTTDTIAWDDDTSVQVDLTWDDEASVATPLIWST